MQKENHTKPQTHALKHVAPVYHGINILMIHHLNDSVCSHRGMVKGVTKNPKSEIISQAKATA